MSRPLIGVLGNLMMEPDPSYLSAERVYCNASYLRAVEENGGTALMVSIYSGQEELERVLSLCDGLLFPGGADVDPRLYGEAPHPLLDTIYPEQDEAWVAAFRYAKERQLPVLGICRGMQMMCVASGGSLYQDLSEYEEKHCQHRQHLRRAHPIHKVTAEPGSALAKLLGADCFAVNSMHHQAARTVGKDLCISARAEDGLVEAVECMDGRWIGVQWHPEEMRTSDPRMNRLFAHLCCESAKKNV